MRLREQEQERVTEIRKSKYNNEYDIIKTSNHYCSIFLKTCSKIVRIDSQLPESVPKPIHL